MGVMLALVTTVLLGTLGGGLVTISNAERAIAANFRDAAETLYAAESGAEHVVRELQQSAAWNDWLAGVSASTLTDGTLTPTLASNRVVSLTAMTAAVQAETDAVAAWGSNNPRWRLAAHAPVSQLTAGGAAVPAYVAVWVADDPSEFDGDAGRDTNGILMLRARALGRSTASRSVELIVARHATGGAGATGVRILSWRVVR
jgi:hypothetical protein